MTARFAPFANRFCATCGRPIEQAWKRQPDGSFLPVDFVWCEPCEIGIAPDAPWPVDLRVVEDGYPAPPDEARTLAEPVCAHVWVPAGIDEEDPVLCARCLARQTSPEG